MLQNNAWRWLKAMSHRDNESKVRTGEASINFLFQQYSFKCPCMIIEYCPMHRYANQDFQQIFTSINGSICRVKQVSSNSINKKWITQEGTLERSVLKKGVA